MFLKHGMFCFMQYCVEFQNHGVGKFTYEEPQFCSIPLSEKIKLMLRIMEFITILLFSCKPWTAPEEAIGPLFFSALMKN